MTIAGADAMVWIFRNVVWHGFEALEKGEERLFVL